jgi:hypothetical protein
MRISSAVQGLALGLLLLAAPSASRAQIGIGISIRIGPPVLPVYAQPPCPVDGYLWTPGYWAYGDAGYYWVPGVWVAPPRVGLLWTPGYWGFASGLYGWHAGYWGPHVGFYGGVNYGFGFGGVGFIGGGWAGNVFRYNSAVVNVNTTVVRNVYVDRTVINNAGVLNRASFNGPGGVAARPSPQEQAFSREQHVAATPGQISHQQVASRDRSQLASVNGGHPATAAMDTVNGRRFNQQGRLASGVATGRMKAAQASRVERREANVNREVRIGRQANGGRLTPQEHQQVNRQQNNMSRTIYDDKHAGANAPKGEASRNKPTSEHPQAEHPHEQGRSEHKPER